MKNSPYLDKPTRSEAEVRGHTPGPWISVWGGEVICPTDHAHRSRGGAAESGYDRDHFMQKIAIINKDRHGRGNQEANARLIASAPDLLAALESITRFIEKNQGRQFDRRDWENASRYTQRARAAIHKATGNDPS